jgi:hypothetical protein
MKKQAEHKVTITKEGILKALDGGAASMTAIAKTIGFKSGSSSIIKRIAAVPGTDLKARLAANQAKQDAKDKPSGRQAVEIPDCVPFRKSSGYAIAWSLLYASRGTGISKADLLARYVAATGKTEQLARYDCHVVTSPRVDGTAHRSAAKASGSYWVERRNEWYRLHLVGEKK